MNWLCLWTQARMSVCLSRSIDTVGAIAACPNLSHPPPHQNHVYFIYLVGEEHGKDVARPSQHEIEERNLALLWDCVCVLVLRGGGGGGNVSDVSCSIVC